MKLQHKLGCLALLWAMLLSLLSPCFAAEEAFQEGTVLYISTAQELAALSQACTLDTYSENLTVYLTADIDLTGSGFSPIPIFCGDFQGQGHTISGLSITGDGSHMGFVRYLQSSGRIADLTVCGTVTPGGTASMNGGIVGTNRGTVENCTFSGTVSGQESLGGIVGINEASGLVSGCENQAALSGQAYVGGIAGRNMGTITQCTNTGDVNTTYIEISVGLSLPDLSVDRTDLGVVADVGGIAGLSTGVILSCVNTGTVGCSNTGYNIGGIVGRQSGYVGQCQNTGSITGRKDIGGIVGQAEPYISLDVDGAVLPTLSQELDTLHDLVNDTLVDAESASSAISAGLSAIGSYTYAAAQDAASLTYQIQADVSDLSSDVSQYRQELGYIRDNASLFLADWAQSAQDLSQELNDLLNALDPSATAPTPTPEPVPDDTDQSPQIPADTPAPTSDPVPVETLEPEQTESISPEDALPDTDSADNQEALPELAEPDLQGQPETSSTPESTAATESADQTGIPTQAAAALVQLQDSVTLLHTYTQTLSGDIQALETWLNEDNENDQTGAALTDALSAHLNDAVTGAAPVMADIAALDTALSPYLGDLDNNTLALWKLIQAAGEQLAVVLTDAKSLLDSLGELPEITLPDTTDSVQTLDSMFQNLSGLGSCLSSLNTTVSSQTGSLVDDLAAVNDQFNLVMQLVVQAISGETDLDINLLTDQSDLDTPEPSNGKIDGCENVGSVQGDLDVGGIAGTMGIEYDFDLEGDIFGSDGVNLSASYLTKCVVRSCTSRGEVTSRNNNVGGIAGLMELGTLWLCQSYGAVASTDGDYAGGIAGQSLGSIRGCYALCTLSGAHYVGGIAGLGQNLYDNRALVDVQNAQEQAGAIAGELEDDGICQGNTFVDRGLGGIDNISYANKAEPVAYETLIAQEDTPSAFSSLTITLQAQGQTVAQIPFTYGQSLDETDLPEPPALDGYTGVWEAFDWSDLTFPATVSAVYTAYGATIAADTQRPDDTTLLPLFLAEGSFYPEGMLTVTALEDTPVLVTGETALEAWQITITGAVDTSGSFVLHYRLPDTKDNVTLYLRQADGAWAAIDYSTSGRYALVSIDGSTAELCVVSSSNASWQLWTFGLLGIALLTVPALTLTLRRHKKSVGAHLKNKDS